MQYEFQLNLQQRAALSVAISFWEKKEVKDKVREFVHLCDLMGEDEVEDEWQKLMKTVLEESNRNELPLTLESEVIYFIVRIGEKICNWYLHIKINNEFPFIRPIDYFDKIFWTPHGTVDEVETFKLYLLKNPNFKINQMYCIACSYALEEQVNELWQKLPEVTKNYCEKDMYEDYDQHLLAYWKYRRDGDLSNLIKYFDTVADYSSREDMEEYDGLYNLNHSPEKNMFWVSVNEGHSIAAKYFWDKLTEEERSRSVVDCARMAVMGYDYYNKEDENMKNHKKGKYVELCIFLINRMTKDQRESFFKEELVLDNDDAYHFWDEEKDVKGKILIMLLSVWPWQELLIPVLNDMLEYLKHDSITICKFLDAIARKMIDEHMLGIVISKSKYQSILQTVWSNISESTKRSMVYGNLSSYIDLLLIVKDLASIKLILNDPQIADVRDKYIESGKRQYLRLIMNEQYEFLDLFMMKIFRTEEEKRDFKQKITIWGQLIEGGQSYIAERLVSNRSEQGQHHWRGLDDIGLCEYFVKQKQYDSVDKFLNWKFETEEKKRKCKDHFKKDKFTIEQVYEIWKSCGTNVDKAKENSSRFLHWLLESEEKIACFKKNKIVKSDQEMLFIDYFVRKDLIQIMEDFFFWCLSSTEEVQRIKQRIGKDMGHYISDHSISLGHATEAASFVRWAFFEKESMQFFIEDFFSAENRILTCYNFIKLTSRSLSHNTYYITLEERIKKLNEFVDFWIKPLENIQEFRSKFLSRRFIFYDTEQKEDYNIFMDLLANLEKKNM